MNILLMNASGSSSGHARKRKNEICKIIKIEKPKVVLFQEFKWKSLRGTQWGKNGLPKNYRLLGNTEAAIVFDAGNIDVDDIPANLIDDILRSKKHFPTNFNPRSRMCICLIGNKCHKRFICLSWHGQHTGLRQEEKKLHLQCLLEFVSEIGKKYDIPIMIGGDFNIRKDKISDIVKENGNFEMCNYTPSPRRSTRGVIDYFITSKSSDFRVYDTKYYVLPTKAIDLFDHDPLLCNLLYDVDIQVRKQIKNIISICEYDPQVVFVGKMMDRKHHLSSSFFSCLCCSALSSLRISEPYIKKSIYKKHYKVVIVRIYDENNYDFPYYVVYIYNRQQSYSRFWSDLAIGAKYARSEIMSQINYFLNKKCH